MRKKLYVIKKLGITRLSCSLLTFGALCATPMLATAKQSPLEYKQQAKLHDIAKAISAERIEQDITTLFRRGGHHRPFNDLGFAGVRIMETNENYHRQHQDLRTENGIVYGDTIDGVDFDYAAKLTALNAVSLAGMSWAPKPPIGVQIKGAVAPSTTLSWQALDANQNPQLEGYKIYWRLTDAPQWQFSRYVGNVTTATLENIVIDNYFFGVASVSTTGAESPVVYPGAAGAFGE